MQEARLVAVGVILLSLIMAIPPAMAAQQWDEKICWKKSQERGIGKIPICEQTQEKDAGLCYGACKPGFKGVGPVCWKKCPSGYHDDGATCRRDAHIVKKDSYGRGAGTVPKSCPAGQHFDAGLCYSACTPGYKGIGPVCWPECKNLSAKGIKVTTECGAACSTDRDACSKWVGAWVTDGFGILGDAVQAIDPSKVTELMDSVRKYPANIPYCR